MRKTMLTSFALLGLAIAPAFADNSAVTTQSPPSSNSGEAGIQSDNSLPLVADTSERTLPGDQLGQDQAQSPINMPIDQAQSSANMPVDQAMRDNTASHKVVR